MRHRSPTTAAIVSALIATVVTVVGWGVASTPAADAAPSSPPASSPPAGSAVAASASGWAPAGGGSFSAVLGTAAEQAPAAPKPPAARVANLDPQLYHAAGVPGAAAGAAGGVAPDADGQVLVTVTGSGAVAAGHSVGAQILAQAYGSVTMKVAPSRLRALAAGHAVSGVRAAQRAYTQATNVTAESVGLSGAGTWQLSGQGNGGNGVKLGIVDAGFAGLAAEAAAGRLPASLAVTGNYCGNDLNSTAHGTAVAEIAHQMAPNAQLLLYCVTDNVGFAAAEAQLQAAGVTIVSSSLGFAGDGRGDGTGVNNPPTFVSTAYTVQKARAAGILWVQAAGNSAQDHWSGTFATSTSGYQPICTGANCAANVVCAGAPVGPTLDAVLLNPGDSAHISLTWDDWPSSAINPTLEVQEYNSAGGYIGIVASDSADEATGAGSAPTRGIDIANNSRVRSDDHLYAVRIKVPPNTPAVRYDLTYFGDVSNSLRADPTATYWGCPASAGNPRLAAAGSIAEPASSPYALAVGAVFQGDGSLETFSSQGPTIDGRVKPDLLGYDGVTSNIYGTYNPVSGSGGFFGTSAATPNVAAAAVLVKAANPSFSASQLQDYLLQHAAQRPATPNNIQAGGVLSLPGLGFTAIAPARVMDTRKGIGGRSGPLGAGAVVSVPMPADIPASATSVLVNLAGAGASANTFIAAYPNGYPGTSNLNLSPSTDRTASVSATVNLNAAHRFNVRNNAGQVDIVIDVLGYYAPTGGLYNAVTPTRVFDSRTGVGGPQSKLQPGQPTTVALGRLGLPSTATAVAVNITATNQAGSGYLAAYPSSYDGTATLNYERYTRGNFSVVGLSNGAFQLQAGGAAVDAVIDVVGYYDSTRGAQFYPLANPARVVDTRSGLGGYRGPMPKAKRVMEAATGVPASASAALTGVAVLASGTGYVNVYAAGLAPTGTSTVNVTAGRTVPNAAVVGLVSRRFLIENESPPAQVVVDLFGFFGVSQG